MTEAARVPVVFRTEPLVDWFFEHGVTDSDLDVALGRVGRSLGPQLIAQLCSAHLDGELHMQVGTMAKVIGNVWSMAEYPDQMLRREEWRYLFNRATYTVDGLIADRPSASLTLWRGSVFQRRGDWSWTDNREVAERYAGAEYYQRPRSTVWQATVTPLRLLRGTRDVMRAST